MDIIMRILRNFLAAANERNLSYSVIFLEKKIPGKVYVLSALNDCYEILSKVFTVCGWWSMVETWLEVETCCRDVIDDMILDDFIKLPINCKATVTHTDIL